MNSRGHGRGRSGGEQGEERRDKAAVTEATGDLGEPKTAKGTSSK
jgi:hypothetical protein